MNSGRREPQDGGAPGKENCFPRQVFVPKAKNVPEKPTKGRSRPRPTPRDARELRFQPPALSKRRRLCAVNWTIPSAVVSLKTTLPLRTARLQGRTR